MKTKGTGHRAQAEALGDETFAFLEGRSCRTLGLRMSDTIEALSIVSDNINRMD